MKRSATISRAPAKTRLPEIRARHFDRERDLPSKIENLLSRKQQSKLRAIATVLEYQRRDSTIFSEGEDAHFVYSVASGIVRISRHSEAGRRQVLAFMLPGDLFGIPDAGIYVNSAETVCPVTLHRVPWHQLHLMILREPQMQINLLMRVAFDLRQAQRRIMILGQQNVAQRLASFLLDFVQHPEFFDERRHLLTLPLTRFDLADYLGTTPESVVRTFAKMEKEGLLRRTSSRVIEVRNIGALRRMIGNRRRNHARTG